MSEPRGGRTTQSQSSAQSAKAKPTYVVSFLSGASGTKPPNKGLAKSFHDAMKTYEKIGKYKVDPNYFYADFDDDPGKLFDLAKTALQSPKPAVAIGGSSSTIKALAQANKSLYPAEADRVPIVMALGGFRDLVNEDPGRICGMVDHAPGEENTQVELLVDYLVGQGTIADATGLTGLAFLFNENNAGKQQQVKDLKRAVAKVNSSAALIDLYQHKLLGKTHREAQELLDKDYQTGKAGGALAVIVIGDPLVMSFVEDIVTVSKGTHGLPTMYGSPDDVTVHKGHIAYGCDHGGMFKRAAYFVHRLLMGASPSTLGVEYGAPSTLEVL